MSKCLYPNFNSNPLSPPYPCQRCLSCVATFKKEKVGSMLLQADLGNRADTIEYTLKGFENYSAFVTLTYAPEHLPDSDKYLAGNLNRKDIQLFIKRFKHNWRYKYGSQKISYFGCGEYGTKGSRAHYHVNFFGLDPQKVENIMEKSWQLGHFKVALFTAKDAKYISGYTAKKMDKHEITDGRNPEFLFGSPSLGQGYLPYLTAPLIKHNLIPTRALSLLDRFIILKNPTIFPPDLLTEERSFCGVFIRTEQEGQKIKYRPLLPTDSEDLLEKIFRITPQHMKNPLAPYDPTPPVFNRCIKLTANLQNKLFQEAHPDLYAKIQHHKNLLLDLYTPFDLKKIPLHYDEKIPNVERYALAKFKENNTEFKTFVHDHMNKVREETEAFEQSQDRTDLKLKLEKQARYIAKHIHKT